MERAIENIREYFAPKSQEASMCAFIPGTILDSVIEKDKDLTDQDVLSLRATIDASKETQKEREKVGDDDKNPHEPDLPSDDDDDDAEKWKKAKAPRPFPRIGVFEGYNNSYTILPGAPLGNDQHVPYDPVARECFVTMHSAAGFFRDKFGWNSFDDKAAAIIGTVRYGPYVSNAYFLFRERQMVFGQGCDIMNSFYKSSDIVGHEFTHGIIQSSSALHYRGESGALNESCADIFGSIFEQWMKRQRADNADWLVGQDVLYPRDASIALRNMKHPGTAYDDKRLGGKDPQPGHMKDYVRTNEDFGGVHTNSGIPNRAFYLAAIKERGPTWYHPGKVWFCAMTTVKSNATFKDFADATVKEAKRIKEDFVPTVIQAWLDVGITPEAAKGSSFGWLWGSRPDVYRAIKEHVTKGTPEQQAYEDAKATLKRRVEEKAAAQEQEAKEAKEKEAKEIKDSSTDEIVVVS